MSDYRPQLHDIQKAKQRISGVVVNTPLTLNAQLSERYAANVWLKREDMQIVRSYKIRGAYNKIASLSPSAPPRATTRRASRSPAANSA